MAVFLKLKNFKHQKMAVHILTTIIFAVALLSSFGLIGSWLQEGISIMNKNVKSPETSKEKWMVYVIISWSVLFYLLTN